MNPFSRSDWKRETRRAAARAGKPGQPITLWEIGGALLVLAVLDALLKECGG